MPDFTVQQGTAPADFAVQSPVAVVPQLPAERSLTTLEIILKQVTSYLLDPQTFKGNPDV